MAKHYLFKRPESRFEGPIAKVRTADGLLVDSMPDLARGAYRSPWVAYELSLQSATKGTDILTVLNLRKKLQGLIDPVDAHQDASYVVLTEQERRLLVEAVRGFDWTLPDAKGNSRSPFFVTWLELLEAVLDPDSANYGFSDYDVTRPTADYLADTAAFDARKLEMDAKILAAKEEYAKEKAKQAEAAPKADAVVVDPVAS